MESPTVQYETIIGLEIHVQLSTQSKAFCADDAHFGAAPNTHIGTISLAHPGVLPSANKKQIEYAVKLGLALGCTINQRNAFDRKNYFYADLPKGYQITQDKYPICIGGGLTIQTSAGEKYIRLHHIHMEEDAGKSIHDLDDQYSYIDLNRAGVPLLEIVTEPDMRSGEEVEALMMAMRQLVRWLDVSDGNMEEGSMRCDCNISIREKGSSELNTRCEVKNVNSMRYARRAIEFETKRQIGIVESGGKVVQQTLHFEPQTGVTSPLRDKENAHDYRYFPDPDLRPIVLSDAYIAQIKATSPALPQDIKQVMMGEYNLSEYDASILTEDRKIAQSYIALANSPSEYNLHKPVANFLINKILPYLHESKTEYAQFPINPSEIIELLELIESGKVSNSVAYTQLFPALIAPNRSSTPLALATEMGLIQSADTGFLEGIVNEVIAKYPDKVTEYRKGKKGLLGFFMGEVMKASTGKSEPKATNALLLKALSY